MLNALITSRTKRKVLSLLFLNPKNEFYVREIANKCNEQVNAVRRELATLEKADFITRRVSGKQVYYKVNEKCTIKEELKSILLKTEGFESALKEGLETSKVDFVFVYGSYAKGYEKRGSDIDIVIVGEADIIKLNQEIAKIETTLGRELNYTVFTADEFKKSMKKGFLQNILAGKKIFIVGDEDGFKRFVEKE